MATVAETPRENSPETPPPPKPPAGWAPDRRFLILAIVVDAVALTLAYVAVTIPIAGPKLTPEEANRHWPVALAGVLIVVLGVILVIVVTVRRPAREAEPLPPEVPGARLARWPRTLGFERTSRSTIKLAAAISILTVPLSLALQAPPALAWLLLLAPWIPLVTLEVRWKYGRYGVFACFAALGLLQLLHMVEHSVQIGQLVQTEGDLGRSHGIFGQLDFELVHFVTDTILWIGLGLLITIVRNRNVWLWVAFAAASMHEVEHLYLFWLNLFDNNMYLSGGFNGIMGNQGMIGSPLDRPYMHYAYNLIVFVPMLIAIWDDARRMDRLHPAPEQPPPDRTEVPA